MAHPFGRTSASWLFLVFITFQAKMQDLVLGQQTNADLGAGSWHHQAIALFLSCSHTPAQKGLRLSQKPQLVSLSPQK